MWIRYQGLELCGLSVVSFTWLEVFLGVIHRGRCEARYQDLRGVVVSAGERNRGFQVGDAAGVPGCMCSW